MNPQIVLGADGTRGLYALVNGVRVKIADLDTDTLELDLLEHTVIIKDLGVFIGGALGPLLGNLPLLTPRTRLLTLDLSFPRP